jgi:sulfite reductase (ferredoxin)
MSEEDKLSDVEHIKIKSRNLRGTIASALADDNLVRFSDDDEQLTKFHGFYQGYNRDTATARKKQKLDKEWEMMLRVKAPGGRLTPEKYLALDALADKYSNGSLRVTSRQGIQFHNVMKGDIHPLIKKINEEMMTTLGGCGDVVRNVVACPSPVKSAVFDAINALTLEIHRETLPKTTAYHEIWVKGEKYKPASEETRDAVDPLYGTQWMPRKFKIGICVPEDNTIDVLTNDIGLVALHDNEKIEGYNVYIGGGFGMKHNTDETYPRLASSLGFVESADAAALCKAIIKFQRDFGDRHNRQHARLKYVVEEKGDAFCKGEIEKFFGKEIAPLKDAPKLQVKDHLGWHEQGDEKLALGVPVTSGRIKDADGHNLRTALREIVAKYKTPVILMPTEDIILCDIEPVDKEDITAAFKAKNVVLKEDHLPIELWAMSCVALPTCGKALTEGERARIPIVSQVRKVLEKHNMQQEKLSVRITGCPNGCSRPYTGDIGIVGRAPGLYAMYVGGDFEGTRLSLKVADKVKVENIGAFLEPFFDAFAAGRANDNEGFGDFCCRMGMDRLCLMAAASGVVQ